MDVYEADMDVTWSDYLLTHPPVAAEESIRAAERTLGVRFPADYLAVARNNQGRSPSRGLFALEDGSDSVFNDLLHFEKAPSGNLVKTWLNYEDLLPKGVIPFATDPGGNLLCFDYRQSVDKPTVVFWEHDNPGAPTQRVAVSFTDLIEKLRD